MDHGWLLAPGRREVVYKALFAAVKQIVRANTIDDEKRMQIKSWLKQNGDTALCLLSLTVGAVVLAHEKKVPCMMLWMEISIDYNGKNPV